MSIFSKHLPIMPLVISIIHKFIIFYGRIFRYHLLDFVNCFQLYDYFHRIVIKGIYTKSPMFYFKLKFLPLDFFQLYRMILAIRGISWQSFVFADFWYSRFYNHFSLIESIWYRLQDPIKIYCCIVYYKTITTCKKLLTNCIAQ